METLKRFFVGLFVMVFGIVFFVFCIKYYNPSLGNISKLVLFLGLIASAIVATSSFWIFKYINQKSFSMKIIAITSTTILPKDGTYSVARLDVCPDITGVVHYVGHPATKTIVESKGAIQAPSKLFLGLEVGESMICFAIKQGMSDRSQGGTAANQEVSEDMLEVRAVTRLA